jgi:hypothetical protein
MLAGLTVDSLLPDGHFLLKEISFKNNNKNFP